MKAVILAGGLGTRLSEETLVRPKPMVEIGGKPLLWHIMKIYSKYGVNDFEEFLGENIGQWSVSGDTLITDFESCDFECNFETGERNHFEIRSEDTLSFPDIEIPIDFIRTS